MFYQLNYTSLIENVGFEPRFCVPGAACCHYTTFSRKRLQRESNPYPRIDSPAYSPLYYGALFIRGRPANTDPPVILAAHGSLLSRKKTACLFGQAVVSAIHCFQSVHSTMHTGAPGPRRPLDPALERHVLLMLSDFSSEGI